MNSPSSSQPTRRHAVVTALIETFGFSPWLATITALFLALLAALAVLWIILSAPPRTITIISGPPGSIFQRNAERYAEELAKHGVTLKIVPSSGSRENLERLATGRDGIDLGFVQGGLIADPKDQPPDLRSLGTISNQPVWVFTRGTDELSLLSQLAGQRVGIGAPGSGVQALARALLEANGIKGPPTTLVESPSEEEGKDFLAGKLDAIFLTGDSAPTATVRALLRAPEVQVYNFSQADAYVRRVAYLNKIVIPRGGIDFGLNLPAQDITLVGPGVELVARAGLNSAISDLLLDVAQKIHGRPGLLAKRGEFPAPRDGDFPLSADAKRFYKSGKGITYDLIDNFWIANLVNRLLIVIVPSLIVLIPVVRLLPVVYQLSVKLRIYRRYRPLLRLERNTELPLTPEHVKELLAQLDLIERDVDHLRVPASFAQQFYDLRTHVAFVRGRLKAMERA